jgi:hypothetical protein
LKNATQIDVTIAYNLGVMTEQNVIFQGSRQVEHVSNVLHQQIATLTKSTKTV